MANAAGVILVILGVLAALLGVGFLAIGGLWNDGLDAGQVAVPEGLPTGDLFGQIIVVTAVIVLFIAVGYILAGIGVLRASSAGRWAGIVLGVIGALLTLPGGLSGGPGGDSGGAAVNLGIVALHVFVVLALAFRWHPARRPAG